MQITIQVDSEFIKELRTTLKDTVAKRQTDLELIKSAMTLYRWAVKEASLGRVILSTDEDGTNPTRVAMPALTSVI